MEERKYTEVFNYLWKNEYPDGADKCKKRSIRQMSGSYEVKDGLLVLKGTNRRWIANEKEKSMILTACHDHPLGKETTLWCNNECGKNVTDDAKCYASCLPE